VKRSSAINRLYLPDASSNHAFMPRIGFKRTLVGLCFVGLVVRGMAAAYIVDSAPPGLPQSSVIAMTQTRDGYLWLGTKDGLARFDGNHYEVFREWNTPGLSGNTIVHLFEDSRGGLWVGAGISVGLIQNGRVTTLDIPGGSAELRSTCEDVSGAVWLYLADGRLARWRNDKVEQVWLPELKPSATRAVIATRAGQIWIGTDSQLFRVASDVRAANFELFLQTNALPGKLDYLCASPLGGFWLFANEQIYRVAAGNSSEAKVFAASYPWGKARVMTALEDQAGNLIVGTQNGGVFRFSSDGQCNAIEGLSQNTALSLCEDREGNLWIGTDGGGLNRVKGKPFRVLPAGRDWVVQSVSAETNGNLWLGFNGGGVTYATTESWQDFGPAQGIVNPNFSAVLVDRHQRVWVGTRDGGLFELVGGRFQPASDPRLLGRNISVLFEDRQGNLWVGTDAGLACWTGQEWRWLNRQSGLSADRITAMAEDRAGNLWIGTERNGLNRWRDGKFSSYHQGDGLPSENITALCVDADDVLWIGTGNGLGRLSQGRWNRFTTKDGLASDSISYLIEDDQEHLWIGSSLGLMRLEKKSLTSQAPGKIATISCRVYSTGDGLPTSECTQGSQPAACRTSDGRLWFPTIRGLVSVNPAELILNTNLPLVAIESVLLDDQEQHTNRLDRAGLRKLVIPAHVERLDIFYTSLNLTAPRQARFTYWMEGHEERWNSPTDRRSVSYSRLPPGEYRFRVKACNEDGYWNTLGAELSITVLPPFWKTWWFQTLVVAALLGLVVGIVYFVSTQKLQRQLALLRQQEALEKERARIARDLHDQLGANLTQVGLLGEMVGEDKDSPKEVAAYAQQICQTARTTSDALDEIVWAANPSNDTLDGLVTYACKYAQDYLALADLRYRLDVPTELPTTNIPPDLRHNVFLAFKESVNNVVKHARATEVKIRLRLDAEKFLIEIEDNGRGPGEAATKTGRNGLRNMRKRMEDVGGAFEMTPGAERGTIVRLTAPITKR
jgi:ligand-binding sensor domain-containing protein/signal transduction histidine kinase